MPMPAKEIPEKYCLACGKRLERHRYNGRLEDYSRFLSRTCCNNKCAGQLNVKDVYANDKQYCKVARQFLGSCCESCGTTERLQAHHIDGQRKNNSPENIQTLCIHCHVSHHHRAKAAGVSPAGRLIPVTTIPVGEETP